MQSCLLVVFAIWTHGVISIPAKDVVSENLDLRREFGSDNCFSVSSFLTFNLVLATTVDHADLHEATKEAAAIFGHDIAAHTCVP